MGCKVLLLVTINIEMLALKASCNPLLVVLLRGLSCEVDASVEKRRRISTRPIQMKMLNTVKVLWFVHFAQADKELYSKEMRKTVENQENLTLRQTMIDEIFAENGKVVGVRTATTKSMGQG